MLSRAPGVAIAACPEVPGPARTGNHPLYAQMQFLNISWQVMHCFEYFLDSSGGFVLMVLFDTPSSVFMIGSARKI
jgi:hypothetical protein